MRLWALAAALPLALLLTTAPGAAAATCTATASGAWTAAGTWDCSGGPAPDDAVVIPAGRTVSVAADDTQSAGLLTLRGTLALGDLSEVDAGDLAASGGTISGPQFAMLVVTVDTGGQATVDGAGLTIDGAYLNVTGDGTLAIAGPLALTDGGWVESDIDTTWTGTAPWRIGGAAGSPASGFEISGAQLGIAGATAAVTAGGGPATIQVDAGSTLVKQDATTSDLEVDVLTDGAAVRVAAGKLIGRFQGAPALALAAGATLGLAGSGAQVTPSAIDAAGGTIEVEPSSDVSLTLPGPTVLHRLVVAAKASLDVGDGQTSPAGESSPPMALAAEIAIAAGADLALDGGGGALSLGDHAVLSGAGTLDAALDNSAGTVSPHGTLHVTGRYAQGTAGTLALDLRGPGDFDSLQVEGAASLAGALAVTTDYAPAATAAPLVLGAASKPLGSFGRVTAPLTSGRSWHTAYTAAGVALGSAATGGGLAALVRPSLQPALPVVGGTTHCLAGKWSGSPALAYRWLRDGKPIAGATRARYRVAPGDRGHGLACRVTATAAGGLHGDATSRSARARSGLRIGTVTAAPGGKLSVALRCAASERRCTGALRVLVGGRPVASGPFALHAPGGVVELPRLAGARGLAGEPAVVHAGYRNGAGAVRSVGRRLLVG